jgi:hypothetical protein
MNHSSPPRALCIFLKLPEPESPELTLESWAHRSLWAVTLESLGPLDQITIYGGRTCHLIDKARL